MTKLSVIIPCYNCEKTLQEAVGSCYEQGFSIDEFEIVMVDDGSTDNSRTVINELAQKYNNIKLVFHKENQGGGATRNTAVTHSSSDVIFCLDSDDILPPGNLRKMYNCFIESKMDGVLFEETRFFTTDTNKTETVKNSPLHSPIEFADIYHKGAGFLTQVNFMYTKVAFQMIGGYPTNHGFDTQTFGLNFLAHSLKCIVCEGTHYLHRHHQKDHKSYYEREYEKGLLSINTYLSLEPIIEKLNDSLINKIIHYPIFTNNYHGTGVNLQSLISDHVQTGGELISVSAQNMDSLKHNFVNLTKNILKESYTEALQNLAECIRIIGEPTDILLYMQIRISMGLAEIKKRHINNKTAEYLTQHHLLTVRKYRHIPDILKPLYYLYNLLLK